MSNPDCESGCGFVCTCGDVDFSRENELTAELTLLRQQLDIAAKALDEIKAKLAYKQYAFTSYNIAVQALAQIREIGE